VSQKIRTGSIDGSKISRRARSFARGSGSVPIDGRSSSGAVSESSGEEAASAALAELRALKNKTTTLLFAAKDTEHNNEVTLLEQLS
jgi:hypothetical protein